MPDETQGNFVIPSETKDFSGINIRVSGKNIRTLVIGLFVFML